jgi:uncharacterized protein (DUF1800 family)
MSQATDQAPPHDPDQPLRPRRARPARRPAPPLSRRNLLISGATAVAAASGTGAVLLTGGTEKGAATAAQAAITQNAAQAATGDTLAQTAATTEKAASTPAKAGFALPKNLDPHLLLRRATYGRTAAADRELARLGPTAWLNRQLTPSKIKDPAGVALARRYPRLSWSAPQARARLKEGDWALMSDTVALHLGRAVVSNRQLYEVMVDFWSNHLNITCPSGDVWDTRHRYQIDVIRKNALGSFESMLLASAVHPAMLVYLNNAQSTKQAPNENYARELLELHTVGVDGGYTERDVQRSALLLTGWSVEQSRARYVPDRHHVGALRVMGFSSPNASASGGRSAQRAYLHYLANHPRTAHNIAFKLARHFVSDTPPAALVNRLALVYRKQKTMIVPVLRALFASPEFAASAGDKVRRPMEHVVATARVLGVKPGPDIAGVNDLVWVVNGMGHAPLGWPMPNGYSDQARDWQSPASALAQFNSTAGLVQGWWPNKLVLPGPKKLLTSPPRTRSGVIVAVSRKVLGRRPTARETAAARKLLAGTSLPASFGAGSWEQQQTVALVTTLLLSSPAHMTR